MIRLWITQALLYANRNSQFCRSQDCTTLTLRTINIISKNCATKELILIWFATSSFHFPSLPLSILEIVLGAARITPSPILARYFVCTIGWHSGNTIKCQLHLITNPILTKCHAILRPLIPGPSPLSPFLLRCCHQPNRW